MRKLLFLLFLIPLFVFSQESKTFESVTTRDLIVGKGTSNRTGTIKYQEGYFYGRTSSGWKRIDSQVRVSGDTIFVFGTGTVDTLVAVTSIPPAAAEEDPVYNREKSTIVFEGDDIYTDYITASSGGTVECGDTIHDNFDTNSLYSPNGSTYMFAEICEDILIYFCRSQYDAQNDLYIIPEAWFYADDGDGGYDTVHVVATETSYPPSPEGIGIYAGQHLFMNGMCFGDYTLIEVYDGTDVLFDMRFTGLYTEFLIPSITEPGGTITVDADVIFTGDVSFNAGSDNVTNILYSSLVRSIEDSALVAGSYYNITDFRTMNYYTDGTSWATDPVLGRNTTSTILGDTLVSSAEGLDNDWTYNDPEWYAITPTDGLTSENIGFSDHIGVGNEGIVDSIKITLDNFNNIPDSNTYLSRLVVYSAGDTIIDTSGTLGYLGIDENVVIPITVDADIINDSLLSATVYFDSEHQGDSVYFTAFELAIIFRDYSGLQTSLAINEGINEPLVVLAISSTTIDSRAYSPAYPQDEIYYDWNPNNWIGDISFAHPDSGMVEGFKGVITYRKDHLLNLSTGYDWRNIKFRRWAATAPVWDDETPYEAGTFVSYLAKIYKALTADTVNDPTTARWVEICDSAAYIGWNSTLLESGIPMDAADFTNVYTFGTGCHDIEVGEMYDNATIATTTNTRLNNIVFGEGCLGIKFDLFCHWMTYGIGCAVMSYGSGCNTMTYGSGCNYMTYGSGCNTLTFAASSINLNVLEGVSGCDLSAVDLTGDYSKTIGKASTGELYLKYETWDTDHMDIIYTLICVP